MSLLRMQNRTPPVYCEESRDFQLFCRLYDAVINNVLFDTDTITNILNAKDIRSSFLSLLQTKLGFFTIRSFNDDTLRYVLGGFPLMVKYKGSKQSIIYAVNTFLKINKIDSPITVTYQQTPLELANGYVIPDHTIVVGIRDVLQESSILEEIFRYILPIGTAYYFYYYQNYEELSILIANHSAQVIFISDNINSIMRSENTSIFTDIFSYDTNEMNRLVGAVDTVNLISSEKVVGQGDLIYTSNVKNTFDPGDDLLFLGVHYGDETVYQYVVNHDLNTNLEINKSIIVYNEQEYLYTSAGIWTRIKIEPAVEALPESEEISGNEVVVRYLNSNDSPGYYVYNGNWRVFQYPIYMLDQYEISDKTEDENNH